MKNIVQIKFYFLSPLFIINLRVEKYLCNCVNELSNEKIEFLLSRR